MVTCPDIRLTMACLTAWRIRAVLIHTVQTLTRGAAKDRKPPFASVRLQLRRVSGLMPRTADAPAQRILETSSCRRNYDKGDRDPFVRWLTLDQLTHLYRPLHCVGCYRIADRLWHLIADRQHCALQRGTPNFDTSELDLSGFCWPTFEISMG